MQEIQHKELQKTHIEETLNLTTLQGDTLEVDERLVNRRPQIAEKSFIRAPDDLSFDYNRLIEVVDGFTQNARKNIITVTTKKLRVYAVSEDRIRLASCSDLPESSVRFMIDSGYRCWTRSVFSAKKPSLQFVNFRESSSLVLEMSQIDGKLKKIEKPKFGNFGDRWIIGESERLPEVRRSRIASFVHISGVMPENGATMTQLGLRVGYRARRWFDLTEVVRARETKLKSRFIAQMLP